MDTRQATLADCRAIAELALIAGEGIPAWFWAQSKRPEQSIADVGAHNAASETENFSYRNTQLAIVDNRVAGMLLAYPLPMHNKPAELDDYPAFIRPLIELEQCVPGSFYINMLATYPEYRNRSIGSALMQLANSLAAKAGCTLLSVEVFAANTGALRLYRRLGYKVVESRPLVPHECIPHRGEVLLLTRDVDPAAA